MSFEISRRRTRLKNDSIHKTVGNTFNRAMVVYAKNKIPVTMIYDHSQKRRRQNASSRRSNAGSCYVLYARFIISITRVVYTTRLHVVGFDSAERNPVSATRLRPAHDTVNYDFTYSARQFLCSVQACGVQNDRKCRCTRACTYIAAGYAPQWCRARLIRH